MIGSLTCVQVRQVDHDAVTELGLPSLLLMENAARGVCEAVVRMGLPGSVTILAGPGNNGGDGLAVARLLAAMAIPAKVFLIRGGKSLSKDAAENLDFLLKSGVPVSEPETSFIASHLKKVSQNDLLIDALLGTGIRGSVRTPFLEVIQAVNESGAKVLAVDVPSGLDCDLGMPCGVCVRADRTVTFVARKVGFLVSDAQEFTGEVEVCHIGIPQEWLIRWSQRPGQVCP